MTNSSSVFVTILNLEFLLNFSVEVLRFIQTNKNTEYNTKFTLREGPKINHIRIVIQNHEFRDLSKLHAITLESSISNLQHLETNCVPLSDKIVNLYSCAQSCNENKLTPMCFLLNSRSHSLTTEHDCFTILPNI